MDFKELKEHSIEDHKSSAFQLAQTIALIEGKEIFTKKVACAQYPDLTPFIYREQTQIPHLLHLLNTYKDILLHKLEHLQLVESGTLNLFYVSPKHLYSESTTPNWLHCNARGVVVDLKGEECITYPATHDAAFHQHFNTSPGING